MASEWIKCSERLPEVSDHWKVRIGWATNLSPVVRVWDAAWDTQYDATLTFDDDGKPVWEPMSERDPVQDITHWMPLPEPPDAR